MTGENSKGEKKSYFDPDATAPGYYLIADGDEKTFVATDREVFAHMVHGYRIDTWEDGIGWVKGEEKSGRSVTIEGENTIRRLVWKWKINGFMIFVR